MDFPEELGEMPKERMEKTFWKNWKTLKNYSLKKIMENVTKLIGKNVCRNGKIWKKLLQY